MSDLKAVTFEQFYNDYPRKVGRYTAERSFKKLSVKDKINAYNGLKNYLRYWKANETEKQFIPHPSTFLNQKRWEDEVELPEDKVEWKRDSTGHYIGYCSKCRVSDFFNVWELKNIDSRCCKAKIVPKRK